MDGLIDRFHRAFGFPDGGRGQYPYGRVLYFIGEEDYSGGKFLLAEPELFFSYGEGWKFIFGGKFPLKRDGFRSGKPWGYMGFSWEKTLYFLSLKGEHGYAFGEGRMFFSRIEAEKNRFSLGLILRTSPYGKGEISHPATALYVRVRLKDGFYMGFIEDMAPYDTSADFTVFISLFK